MGYNLDQCGYPHEEEEILAPLDLIQRYEEERSFLNAEIDQVLAEITAIMNGTRDTPSIIDGNHSRSRLEDFNRRFPVDMQKSLLQWAIQGKLVEQRLEEGTAEELYRQIQEEKRRLIREEKVKKEKPLPEIAEDEMPFEIPGSWKWVHIRDITLLNPKNDLEDNFEVSFIPMALISDGFQNSHTHEIRQWKEIKKDSHTLPMGTLELLK